MINPNTRCPKVKLRPTGGRLLLIGGGKEFPGPNPYEMEVRNVQNGLYNGGKRFPGGDIFPRKSFLGRRLLLSYDP